jgi:transporter family-2 protein
MTALGTHALVAAAVIAGAMVAAQGPIFARMAQHAGGPLQAAFIAFSLGLAVILLFNLVAASELPQASELTRAPKWVWLGGVIGALMVILSIFAIPKIGVGAFMAAVIFGQLIAAVAFDHFGMFGLTAQPISWARAGGAGLMLAGLWLIVWK